MKIAKSDNYNKIKKLFIYLLPVSIFFSYYPLISLGSDSSTNFELSIPLIWLSLFALVSLPSVFCMFKENFPKRKVVFIISLLFPLYSTISIIWSANLPRAILTSGVIWCLYISIASILDFLKVQKEINTLKTNLIKIFFLFTAIVCVFCWVQCFLDVFGIARESTLLCAGCTVSSFGFPHPNGFAIEPQFMGNLLLAPTFLAIYLFLKDGSKNQKRKYLLALLFFSSTLFLTMSRGAIYAFIVGLVVFIIMRIIKQKSTKVFKVIPVLIVSFIFTLAAQGIFSEFSSTNDTFLSGVSKVVSQMSLGIIDIPYNLKTNDEAVGDASNETISHFDGYVEDSTNIRVGFSSLAIKTWTSSPERFIFGTGIGSAGKAMHETFPDQSGEKEIVQNELFEIALELGLIGVIILVASIILLIMTVLKIEKADIILPILISYFITYLFFSGLPNALHIFLLPAVLIASLKKRNR